ncbi:cupredoxin domain-containing protein [Euzebya rosea]|uniref:cupredoxin domain-containing protein n=1 Tax=Euzebya rosea TaxID=2052804 RepID=UPI00147418FF|nr:cupredoxin domain-containing protein [Euzebya rosea]
MPTTHHRLLRAALAVLALLTTACSTAPPGDDDSAATRTIEVTMRDIAFEPNTVTVADGETVRLQFTNEGTITHDAFAGDEAAQDAHEEEMAEMADMDHGTDDSDAEGVTVQPGEDAELLVTGGPDGTLIGCHQPGHYASGMVITIQPT